MRLPSLRLTARQVGTGVSHCALPRGVDQPLEVQCDKKRRCIGEESQPDLLADAEYSDLFIEDDTDMSSAPDVSSLSLHVIKQKASVAAWGALRTQLLNTVTECSAMPEDQLCTHCCVAEASFRCLQCGPCSYYCHDCLHEWHTCNNVFHMAEEWKV